jgi:hypothetical protein
MEPSEEMFVICKKCYSEEVAAFPADIRLYMNRARTVSAAPLSPAPEIAVCLNCGFSEFVIAPGWLSAGWLRPFRESRAAMLERLARASRGEAGVGAETAHSVAGNGVEQQDGEPGLVDKNKSKREVPFDSPAPPTRSGQALRFAQDDNKREVVRFAQDGNVSEVLRVAKDDSASVSGCGCRRSRFQRGRLDLLH